jgi:hypothetical protein
MGGFDTAFGVGTPTGGGEDLDLFARVVLDGGVLVLEPSAIVWHRHRAELAGYRRQARGYGVGLGAWLTKVAVTPRSLALALRRAPRAVARLARKGAGRERPAQVAPGMPRPYDLADDPDLERELARLARYELACVALGPLAFARQRLAGRRTMRS